MTHDLTTKEFPRSAQDFFFKAMLAGYVKEAPSVRHLFGKWKQYSFLEDRFRLEDEWNDEGWRTLIYIIDRPILVIVNSTEDVAIPTLNRTNRDLCMEMYGEVRS